LYNSIQSNRAKFIQWSKINKHDISEYLSVPETYPEWLNFNKYSNLVDFELDIVSISLGTIIFSESIGAYTEIGMFSCFPKLHKNILVIAPEKYIKDSCESFFNYGAIRKIKENMLSDELINVWALDSGISNDTESYNKLFLDISNHFLDIITAKNIKIKFDKKNRYHIILLILDLIDLFPSQTIRFYRIILEKFGIKLVNDVFRKIITILELLELIIIRQSGKNVLYKINPSNLYTSCLNYQADSPKKFERADFKIKIRKY
ncbi:hypothetical protein BKG91_12040, partial [Rodentibacter caecimuris]|uniref:retron St85 family effector protein n=1 Tax=Rodentibacter caecimuris TaxID=1796644 RepID=UPI000988F642